MLSVPKRFRWVYVLPFVHFFLYLFTLSVVVVPRFPSLAVAGGFIMLADLPISLVAYALAWKYSSLAALWILIVGTAWWYLLSRGIELAIDRLRDRGTLPRDLIPKRNADASTHRQE
jgi:hypothetical protein